jgi:hypothetical protein
VMRDLIDERYVAAEAPHYHAVDVPPILAD